MNLKVGDKISIWKLSYRGNGSGESILEGEVVQAKPERVKIRLPNKEEIDIPWEEVVRIEILGVKESIFQKAVWAGIMVLLLIMEVIIGILGLVALGVFIAGGWTREKLVSLKNTLTHRFKRR